jgi:hypothetical protein
MNFEEIFCGGVGRAERSLRSGCSIQFMCIAMINKRTLSGQLSCFLFEIFGFDFWNRFTVAVVYAVQEIK